MAATFEFEEDNGAATGSPLKGTTRTGARTDVNWKNIDDSTTAYSSSPITAGNNSFDKWQFGHFSGTYNHGQATLLVVRSTRPARAPAPRRQWSPRLARLMQRQEI